MLFSSIFFTLFTVNDPEKIEEKYRIGKASSKNLAEMLKINQSLTTLSLDGNNFGGPGMTPVLEALKSNSTLKKLNLSFKICFLFSVREF